MCGEGSGSDRSVPQSHNRAKLCQPGWCSGPGSMLPGIYIKKWGRGANYRRIRIGLGGMATWTGNAILVCLYQGMYMCRNTCPDTHKGDTDSRNQFEPMTKKSEVVPGIVVFFEIRSWNHARHYALLWQRIPKTYQAMQPFKNGGAGVIAGNVHSYYRGSWKDISS